MPIDAATIADQLLLGRYRVLEERGKGGFGAVSVCWDPRLMRRVAIKCIPLHMAEPVVKPSRKRAARNIPMAGGLDSVELAALAAKMGGVQAAPDPAAEQAERETLLRAALAETRTASMLSHPNIVSMLEFEHDNENAYIIMEYVDGASLAELLDATDDGLLTADEAAAVVEGVCDALQFAHDNGVLHLDIKPDNILVDLSGRVKLADFGMAALSSVTGFSGLHGGTVGYMPPEQIEGSGVDVRTDVFAFACVMYEALTGVRPFAAANLRQSLELVERGAADPCALNESVTPQAADALLAALDPDPSARPTSAEAFADELLAGLGRPKAGRKSLASFAADVLDDSAPDEDAGEDGGDDPYAGGDGAWDRELGPLSRSFPRLAGELLRGLGALGAGGAVALSALSVAGDGQVAAAAVAGIAVALLSCFALKLGYALAYVALAAACCAAGQWAFGVAALTVGAAWWMLVGRARPRGAAGVLWTGPQPLAALLGGYLLPPGSAALSALASFAAFAAAACLAGSMPGAAEPRGLLALFAGAGAPLSASSPVFWLTGASWVAAAATMGALCNGRSKTSCYLGCLLSGVVLALFGLVVSRVENGGSWSGLAPEVAACAVGSTILMSLCVFMLGTPRALDVDGAEPGGDVEATREDA